MLHADIREMMVANGSMVLLWGTVLLVKATLALILILPTVALVLALAVHLHGPTDPGRHWPLYPH